MSKPLESPKIYHITHIENLSTILSEGCIWSDAECLKRFPEHTKVGMSEIKQRRLEINEVRCHPSTKVGEYVPFYFCPRSIMLYILWQANHDSLTYRGGQEPILHLESDLHTVIAAANANGDRWAFTTCNAGVAYPIAYYNNISHLNEIDWGAVQATQWKSVKERKQAEFLLHGSFPWSLVERVGVFGDTHRQMVAQTIAEASHQPIIEVRREWYY